MAVIPSYKVLELAQADPTDPDVLKQTYIDAINLTGVTTWGENLLVMSYIRPERTRGGILRPADNIREDEFQTNVGLVVQVGDGLDDAEELLHQWVRFSYNSGQKWRYVDTPLRDISIGQIRGTVDDPNKVL